MKKWNVFATGVAVTVWTLYLLTPGRAECEENLPEGKVCRIGWVAK